MIGTSVFYEPRKSAFAAKLSLVSLMDIFTILVFFLLLNSGDSQEIENAKFVELPDSISGVAPHTDLLVTITESDIRIGEQVVVALSELDGSEARVIEPLADALRALSEQQGELGDYEQQMGRAITILGDRRVSYTLLQQVLTTCQQADYRNISLAVNRIQGGGAAPIRVPEGEPEGDPLPDTVTGIGPLSDVRGEG